jgi:hypothetical protein
MFFWQLYRILPLLFVGSTVESSYWNSDTQLTPFRLPMSAFDAVPEYEDLDNDGDPDVLRTVLADGKRIQWIDDDDDMQEGDLEGDTDSDCLMVDMNGDGLYGHWHDLISDWNDEDGDGHADMQIICENGSRNQVGWNSGDYMIVIDTDNDGILNYIDWNEYSIKAWDQIGQNKFYTDYLGQTLFIKAHTAPYSIRNLEYNWENPFLFYDYDGDGLSELTIRCLEYPYRGRRLGRWPDDSADLEPGDRVVAFNGTLPHVAIGIDMDNDNIPAYAFDYDMSIGFHGPIGINYADQKNYFKSLRGLPEADKFFYDPRWRQMTHLTYPTHETAWDLIFERGQWTSIEFTYDEDDDTERWERVEFYDQADDLFKAGARKGGIDRNPQADVSGNRAAWDDDASGQGQLYISPFDGRIHLYGAEWGVWRIDQEARHRFNFRWRFPDWKRPEPPDRFATVRYQDTDENGFIDQIQYDIDGDTEFETTISLIELGIDDSAELIDLSDMEYADIRALHDRTTSGIWQRAQEAVALAEEFGLNTQWYAFMKNAQTQRERYDFGYWLNFYIYMDLLHWAKLHKRDDLLTTFTKAYYSGSWSSLKK